VVALIADPAVEDALQFFRATLRWWGTTPCSRLRPVTLWPSLNSPEFRRWRVAGEGGQKRCTPPGAGAESPTGGWVL